MKEEQKLSVCVEGETHAVNDRVIEPCLHGKKKKNTSRNRYVYLKVSFGKQMLNSIRPMHWKHLATFVTHRVSTGLTRFEHLDTFKFEVFFFPSHGHTFSWEGIVICSAGQALSGWYTLSQSEIHCPIYIVTWYTLSQCFTKTFTKTFSGFCWVIRTISKRLTCRKL